MRSLFTFIVLLSACGEENKYTPLTSQPSDEPAAEPDDSAEPAIEPSEPSTEPIDNDGD